LHVKVVIEIVGMASKSKALPQNTKQFVVIKSLLSTQWPSSWSFDPQTLSLMDIFNMLLSCDGSRSKIFDPGRVWSDLPSLVWVLKIYHKNIKFFNFFPFESSQKVPALKAGQPLISCRLKVCLGRVRAHLYFYPLIMSPSIYFY